MLIIKGIFSKKENQKLSTLIKKAERNNPQQIKEIHRFYDLTCFFIALSLIGFGIHYIYQKSHSAGYSS